MVGDDDPCKQNVLSFSVFRRLTTPWRYLENLAAPLIELVIFQGGSRDACVDIRCSGKSFGIRMGKMVDFPPRYWIFSWISICQKHGCPCVYPCKVRTTDRSTRDWNQFQEKVILIRMHLMGVLQKHSSHLTCVPLEDSTLHSTVSKR